MAEKTAKKRGKKEKHEGERPKGERSILELMKDGWFSLMEGIGISEESATRFIKTLQERGAMNREEAQRRLRELLQRVRENRREFEAKLNRSVKKSLESIKMPAIEEIKKEIGGINKKVEELGEKVKRLIRRS